jgi:hypothetical protein
VAGVSGLENCPSSFNSRSLADYFSETFCLQETPDVRESGLEPLTHQLVSSYLLYHHLVDHGFASFQQRSLWFEPSIVDGREGDPGGER